ncbi:PAS domain S-box protein [Rubrivirga sp. IMCC43871]|uniref:hybrid sensor histidine kinase/response regulator n=1 Tax=Rubrivirga sp. IMCC43871 TaxID=3391575 RepID=UPI0039902870
MQTAHWLSVTLFSIGDAVIATDAEARVTFMNPVAESLTGWTAEDAAGTPLDTVFHIVNEETRRTVESPVTKALREGTVVGLANHTLLIAKDGTERPIDDSAAPIRDEAGEVAGVVLVFRDITERHQHEEHQRSALEYATNILATLRESLLVLDKDLRVVSANAAFYETFHASKDNTEGRLVFELGDAQWDIPRLRTLLEELLPQNHEFNDFEVEHTFPGVGRKVMRLNARRVRKPGNHSELILLAIEDVTEARLARYEMEVSEQRYRRLFESARDGILILDARTMSVIDANPYMSELLGYTKEEFEGKQLWEIGLFRDKSESEAAVRTLRTEGYVRYEDLPLQTEHGGVQEVEFICNVYREDSSDVAQCNIRDITSRLQMERQIQAQARELADAGRRKDEFLAMLSHELRNPMAPIFSALHLIGQSDGENALQREARGVIERQVRHLSRLTDDLLEVSRITTGRVRLHTERVDLNGVVARAVERVQPLIERRGQVLSVARPRGPLWLHADATRLEQVVGNLLDNASKYNDDGGHVWLEVGSEAGADGASGSAVVRVRDDGIGMAPSLVPRIFDLFTQADKSLDRSKGGLGIGLALVKNLVELHRGTAEAHSDGLGRGSTFVIRLPLADGRAPESASEDPTTITADSLRVLVVDDNEDAARMSAMLLRMWGHEVRVAHDGPAALERAAGFHPHVILLDIGLPGMDGYEVARHVRQTSHLQSTRLVAVTGYGQDSDRRRSEEAGFDVHLTKPVEPAVLKGLLAGFQPAAP